MPGKPASDNQPIGAQKAIAGRGGTSPIGTTSANTGAAANTNSTYAGGAFASGLNFQTGTAYTVQSTDYQGVILFNTASPVSVALNSAVGENFTCQIVNLGSGAITLTPTLGYPVNSAAMLVLGAGVGVTVYFANRSWSAFSGAQFIDLTSVNSATVRNPNFNDSSPGANANYQNVKWQHSGSDVSAEVPYASSIGFGIVRVDSTSIGVSGGVIGTIGLSTTVALAKLTAGGTNGSLLVANGLITGYTPPT